MEVEQERQPLLPRVGMIWFFIIVTIVAITLGIVRSADQGQALAIALVFTGLFVFAFFGLTASFFAVAYVLGATNKTVVDAQLTTKNPFADGDLPEQILPQRATD